MKCATTSWAYSTCAEVFLHFVQNEGRNIYDRTTHTTADLHPGGGGDVVDRVHGHGLGYAPGSNQKDAMYFFSI